jgi:formate--tetrahydrofolate ligase
MGLADKARTIAREIYGAHDIFIDGPAMTELQRYEEEGFGKFPVCMAKTQYSFSTDPAKKGAPSDHTVEVREVRLSAGAEFIVAICGDIMTMPGLPRTPAAEAIGLNEAGEVVGLF